MKKILAIAAFGLCVVSGSAFASNDTINGVGGKVTTTEGSSSTSIGVSSVSIVNADQIWLFFAQFLGY